MDKREHVLYTLNIAEDQEDKRIQSSNAFDPSHENIYFLVGKKVNLPIFWISKEETENLY